MLINLEIKDGDLVLEIFSSDGAFVECRTSLSLEHLAEEIRAAEARRTSRIVDEANMGFDPEIPDVSTD